MKKQLDELLKDALTPIDEPSFLLNQKILNQVKEKEMIGKEKRKLSIATILLVFVLCLGSVTVYGAWKYLSSADVAKKMEDNKLAEIFISEQAHVINETQTYGGYQITLLSIVSGELLTEHPTYDDDGTIMEDRTYAVVAIENADGTPMPSPSEDAYGELEFFASPLIKGYNPIEYNIVRMSGGYSEIEEDGILYRLLECDNVEKLVKEEWYICVSDSIFYNARAYQYDELTGEISRNEAYDGLNALFVLSMEE